MGNGFLQQLKNISAAKRFNTERLCIFAGK